MKIIKFRNTGNPEELEIDVIPDSAIQKSGKPFFVPDFASRFQFSAAAAVHVCRLGKNIAQRFACPDISRKYRNRQEKCTCNVRI